jgi:hypothetical protein
MLARIPAEPRDDIHKANKLQQEIYLVYRDYPPPLAGYINKVTEGRKCHCIYTNLLSQKEIPSGSSVISLIDLDSSTLLHYGPEYFQAIKTLVAKSSVLAWIATRDMVSNSSDLAVMKGILRSVAAENVLLNVAHLEIDSPYFHNMTRTAELITSKVVQMQSCDPRTTIDRECVLRDGAFHIERLVPDIALNESFRSRQRLEEDVEESLIDLQQALKPSYRHPGLLSSLYFEPDQLASEPPKEGWVQIKTEAIGLNMKVRTHIDI